jgi:outer membrane protein OmpA-like peptidoglycan-associated protein
MKKNILPFLMLFFCSIIFSQGGDEWNYEFKKLELNSSLSEVSTYTEGGYLFLYRNKPFYKINSKFYDLYRVKINESLEELEVQHIDNSLNSRFNEGPVSFDDKRNLIYLTRNKYSKKELKKNKEEHNLLEILIFEKNGEDVKFKEKFKYNDSTASVGHPSYSELTNRLYFSSKTKGGSGQSDLYYCNVLPNGSYSEPINLGKKINTKGNELFAATKQGVLYFSSSGLKTGRSDLDIYYVTELGIENGERPKKLDAPFNSNEEDFGITFINGHDGYLTSNRGNTSNFNHDIYYFNIGEPIIGDDEFSLLLAIEDEKREKLTAENFKVLNKETREEHNKEVTEAGIIIENIKENTVYELVFDDTLNIPNAEIGEYKKETKTDYFKTDTLVDKASLIVANIVDSIKIDEVKQDSIVTQDSILVANALETSKENSKYKLYKIYFEFDGFNMVIQEKKKLDEFANYLLKNNQVKIKISAHTDSRGNANYNLLLSQNRAKSVYDYLIQKNIPANRIIESKGYGETNPSNKCKKGVWCSNIEHSKNRRVEFVIIN